jgi:hypothetical protein
MSGDHIEVAIGKFLCQQRATFLVILNAKNFFSDIGHELLLHYPVVQPMPKSIAHHGSLWFAANFPRITETGKL